MRLPSGGEGNFLGKALAVALGHANDKTVKKQDKKNGKVNNPAIAVRAN
jgi:hypothetical protein